MYTRGIRILGCLVALASIALFGGIAVAGDAAPENHTDITILSDKQFDAAHGVRSGTGSAADPYVIARWKVGNIRIKDTNAHVAIRDNHVKQRLTLNFIGPGAEVTGNRISDLRVNENVKRVGTPTSGVISRNTFDKVGQLRHWDGTFERNVVGTEGRGLGSQAVNFDGFHGARFTDNTVFGYVDVRLHGHHHGSSYDASAHNHAVNDAHPETERGVDHKIRWHEVFVSGNRIVSTGEWALRYYDQAHAANDRTNASETEPELNKPHIHHTRVHMNANKLAGAGLYVDIFNADDRRHTGTARGDVEIRDNVVDLASTGQDSFGGRRGIVVRHAKDVNVALAGNSILGAADESPLRTIFNSSAGIELQDVDLGDIRIVDNKVTNRRFGVRATSLTESVQWWVVGLRTDGVEEDVQYDQSVSNPPQRA